MNRRQKRRQIGLRPGSECLEFAGECRRHHGDLLLVLLSLMNGIDPQS